jgi:hypothetical protein
VEARLPSRQVEFVRSRGGRAPVPVAVSNENPSARESNLSELFGFLESVLEVKPVLLRAAGAISISAGPEELDRISHHPLVKRIEPNRRHRIGG